LIIISHEILFLKLESLSLLFNEKPQVLCVEILRQKHPLIEKQQTKTILEQTQQEISEERRANRFGQFNGMMKR